VTWKDINNTRCNYKLGSKKIEGLN